MRSCAPSIDLKTQMKMKTEKMDKMKVTAKQSTHQTTPTPNDAHTKTHKPMIECFVPWTKHHIERWNQQIQSKNNKICVPVCDAGDFCASDPNKYAYRVSGTCAVLQHLTKHVSTGSVGEWVSGLVKWVKWMSEWASELSKWVSEWVSEWVNDLSELGEVSEVNEVNEVNEMNELSALNVVNQVGDLSESDASDSK
jgi:hypothetical protein